MKKVILLIVCTYPLFLMAQYDINGDYKISGNVGIGTTNPRSNFNIDDTYGEALINQFGHLVFNNKVNSITNFWTVAPRGSGILGIGYGSLINNEYVGSSNDLIGIDSSNGNVGIGTASPGGKLDVQLGTDIDYFKIRRFSSTGRSQFVLADENGVEKWRIGMTAGGNDGFRFYDGAKDVIHSERQGNLILNPVGNVGIGVTNPSAQLHVSNGDVFVSKFISSHATQTIHLIGNTGAGNSKLVLDGQNGDATGGDYAAIYNVNSTASADRHLRLQTNAQDRMVIDGTGNVGIGTNNPTNKLEVNGTIRSMEVKVEASPWPDFVFEEDYILQSLEEVEKYIDSNQHLPDVPSEEEVQENGINLGEMDAKLLQKIEELTLHMIEMNKQIKALKVKNAELVKRIED